jgi:hypothetical protein
VYVKHHNQKKAVISDKRGIVGKKLRLETTDGKVETRILLIHSATNGNKNIAENSPENA